MSFDGLKFFKLLQKDDEFCAELGRVTLAAGKLENLLVKVASSNDKNLHRLTMGKLIGRLKNDNKLSTLIPHLEALAEQRNYLTHNIYNLLSYTIDEDKLERDCLLWDETSVYTERAYVLQQNLNALAELIETKYL
ncbi:hypothetical protein J3998_02500 [Thiomicrorhabdus sp. 6S2-11]|uniref:Uncharacterized protein n=1 Tax=Thiomicrorhabdus marina TaxID=2818442 RepID=A0ABS3Q2A2_9GAMM|nr:hypothetical protein [Thiomicrorhabdus marina]MBO1926432.1 hypothetical protein [Thiomicrorhabdus marina]